MRYARMMLRLLVLLLLLVLLVMVCMVMLVMVQRGAGCIVANLLGQRLTATTQCRAQIIGDFRLSQQLLKNLWGTKDNSGIFFQPHSSTPPPTCVTLSLLAADASTNPFSQSTVTTDSVVAYSTCKQQQKGRIK